MCPACLWESMEVGGNLGFWDHEYSWTAPNTPTAYKAVEGHVKSGGLAFPFCRLGSGVTKDKPDAKGGLFPQEFRLQSFTYLSP